MRSRSVLSPEKAGDPGVCREAALRLLDYKWRGEKELERKLKDRGFEVDVVRATVEKLKSDKWLDDDRFARQFAISRARSGIGTLRIRRELETIGVEIERILPAVREAVVEEAEEIQLAKLCERKVRAGRQRFGDDWAHSDDGRKKIVKFLLNRGYDYGAAQRAFAAELSRLGMTADSDAADLE